MDDPRKGPYLSDVLAGKDPRDVLAERIQTWADTEDWHVYDYVDRLLADLDAAGCNPEDVADLRAEVDRLRDLCRRAAKSAAGYCLIGGVYAELREAGELMPPTSSVAADPTTGTGT